MTFAEQVKAIQELDRLWYYQPPGDFEAVDRYERAKRALEIAMNFKPSLEQTESTVAA